MKAPDVQQEKKLEFERHMARSNKYKSKVDSFLEIGRRRVYPILKEEDLEYLEPVKFDGAYNHYSDDRLSSVPSSIITRKMFRNYKNSESSSALETTYKLPYYEALQLALDEIVQDHSSIFIDDDVERRTVKSTCALGVIRPAHVMLHEFGSHGTPNKKFSRVNPLAAASFFCSGVDYEDPELKELSITKKLTLSKYKQAGWPIAQSGMDRLLNVAAYGLQAEMATKIRERVESVDVSAKLDLDRKITAAFSPMTRDITERDLFQFKRDVESSPVFREFTNSIDIVSHMFGKPYLLYSTRNQHHPGTKPRFENGRPRVVTNYEPRVRTVNAGSKVFNILSRRASKLVVAMAMNNPYYSQKPEVISDWINTYNSTDYVAVASDFSRYDQNMGPNNLMSGLITLYFVLRTVMPADKAIENLMYWYYEVFKMGVLLVGSDGVKVGDPGVVLTSGISPTTIMGITLATTLIPSIIEMVKGKGSFHEENATWTKGFIENFGFRQNVVSSGLHKAYYNNPNQKGLDITFKDWSDDHLLAIKKTLYRKLGGREGLDAKLLEAEEIFGIHTDTEPDVKFLGTVYPSGTGSSLGYSPLLRLLQTTVFPERGKLAQAIIIAPYAKLFDQKYVKANKKYRNEAFYFLYDIMDIAFYVAWVYDRDNEYVKRTTDLKAFHIMYSNPVAKEWFYKYVKRDANHYFDELIPSVLKRPEDYGIQNDIRGIQGILAAITSGNIGTLELKSLIGSEEYLEELVELADSGEFEYDDNDPKQSFFMQLADQPTSSATMRDVTPRFARGGSNLREMELKRSLDQVFERLKESSDLPRSVAIIGQWVATAGSQFGLRGGPATPGDSMMTTS